MKLIRIGRADDNDFIISNPAVSNYHADVYVYDQNVIQYMDHSTNGTSVDGRLIHNQSCNLTGSETITFPGNISYNIYDIVNQASQPVCTEPVVTSRTPMPSAPQAPEPEAYEHKPEVYEKPKMFQNIFSASGRIRRLEYFIVYFASSSIFCLLSPFVEYSEFAAILLLIYIIPYYWVIIAAGIKRCHDLGHSGWFMFVPFYGLIMAFCEGDPGINEYGPSPK